MNRCERMESRTVEPSGVYGWVNMARDPKTFDAYYHNFGVGNNIVQHHLFECEFMDSYYCVVCDQHILRKEAVFRDETKIVKFQ